MSAPFIQTPRGFIATDRNGSARLEWNTNFVDNRNAQFSAAQKFVDSEVLRGCEPYVPMKSGMLIMSGILGTEIGSGFVKYIAPYAHYQYNLPRKAGSETGSLRGPYWFQRWKEVYFMSLLANARKFFS